MTDQRVELRQSGGIDWKALADHLPGGLGICSVYPDGRISAEYFNDAFYALLASSREAAADFACLDFLQPEDADTLRAQLRAAAAEGAAVKLTLRLRAGACRWLNVQAAVLERLPERTTLSLLFSDADAAQQNLLIAEESRDALCIASRSGDMALWVYHPDTRLITELYANGQSVQDSRELHCTPEDFLKTGRIFAGDGPAFLEMYRQIDRGAATGECNARLLHAQRGKYEWHHLTLTRQQSGEAAAIGFCTNVELQMEAEVRYERECRLRRELVKDAVIYYRINLNNHMVEELYSEAMDLSGLSLPVSMEALMARGLLEGCYESDRELLSQMLNPENMLRNYESGKRGESFTYRRNLPGKGLRWLKASIAKLKRVNTDEVIAFFTAIDVDDDTKDQILYRDVMNEEIEGLMTMKVATREIRVLKENRPITSHGIPVLEQHYFAMDEEFRSGLFTDVLPEERAAAASFIALSNVLEMLKTEPVLQHVYFTRATDGRLRRKKVRIFYLDETGQDIIFVRRDITDLYNEQQRQNTALKRAMDETRAANEAKSSFLSRMSHDMRTPLNAIIGYSGEVLRDGASEAQKDEFLDDIHASGEYLLGIINDVLDMSKIESNKMTLHPEPYSFRDFQESIGTVILPLCREKGIAFETEPAPAMALPLVVDKVRFNQIFVNILSNSVKFTPPGGKISMAARCLKQSGSVLDMEFTVADTGCGMSEDFIPHAFDSFSQEYSRQAIHAQQGTGLGLSIVKQLVELMGGSIRIESKLGEGSRFIVRMSVSTAEDAAQNAKADLPPHALAGLHLLLCEDHPMNRKIAIRLLEKEGCTVDTAEDGAIGVQRFRDSAPNSFDAIFMDVRMPNMNGLDAARAIRALPREDAADVPIIAMTANAFVEDRRESLAAGMNAHLAKPIDPAEMYSVLYQLTSGRHVARTPKILVVDDIEMNAAIIARVLQGHYETIIALNGEEALARLAENPYIIAVITDVQMPGMDGGELIRSIRRNPAYNHVALIANTQFGNSRMEEEMIHDGADDFIYKPSAPSLVLSRVENVLGKYR